MAHFQRRFVMKDHPRHPRISIDLPPEVHLAIRVRAEKDGVKNGAIVARAMRQAYHRDIEEARIELDGQKKSRKVQ